MSKQSAEIIESFLHENSITITEFALVTDLSRFTIHRYLKGDPIQKKAARKIEERLLKTYRKHIPFEKLID